MFHSPLPRGGGRSSGVVTKVVRAMPLSATMSLSSSASRPSSSSEEVLRFSGGVESLSRAGSFPSLIPAKAVLLAPRNLFLNCVDLCRVVRRNFTQEIEVQGSNSQGKKTT